MPITNCELTGYWDSKNDITVPVGTNVTEIDNPGPVHQHSEAKLSFGDTVVWVNREAFERAIQQTLEN